MTVQTAEPDVKEAEPPLTEKTAEPAVKEAEPPLTVQTAEPAVKEAEPPLTVQTAEPAVKEAEPPLTVQTAEPAKNVDKEQTKEPVKENVKDIKIARKTGEAVEPAEAREESGAIDKPRQRTEREEKLVWYAIQIGSHKNIQESIKLKKRLVKHGYNAYIRLFDEKGTSWYRVRIGGFKTKSTALRFAKRLEKKENLPTLLIPYEP
ncbi:hypothetical protein MNBD_NITROSPINAE02-1253 [hydrothermal vent metagenome]|uniref:SPOR domain-containing protein n=1 Tax=hydrothermal vent metagenome TaxID=652676 RepID=A0A3B1CMT1_9ZZZZ